MEGYIMKMSKIFLGLLLLGLLSCDVYGMEQKEEQQEEDTSVSFETETYTMEDVSAQIYEDLFTAVQNGNAGQVQKILSEHDVYIDKKYSISHWDDKKMMIKKHC
jgi:hypothetical protein